MKQIIFYLFICSAFLLSSFNTTVRTVHDFNIHVAGMKVGALKATRDVTGSTIIYSLNSDVSFYLLHRYHIKDELTVVYINNMLQTAFARTTVGKNKFVSTITWDRNHYNVDIDGYHYSKKYSEINQIQYSVARLYFEEPPADARVYSEVFGMFSNAESSPGHHYQFIFNDKKSKFSYNENELNKAEIENNFRDFIITRAGH